MQAQIRRFVSRVHAWFDSKEPRILGDALPAGFSRRARLALTGLEDRVVPASAIVTTDADAGAGSLRAAIDFVNLSVDPTNDITFSSFFNSAKTITLASTLPAIAVPVTITGNVASGANTVTISGGGAVRIFDTTAAPTNTVIEFDKLIMSKGAGTAGAYNQGGAITVGDEAITIRNSRLEANTARCGGAINMAENGALNILSSTITGNLATSTTFSEGGGAIYTYTAGTINLQNSTISGNSGALGGGILVYGKNNNAGSFLVLNSTFSGNVTTHTSTSTRGGALYIFGVMSDFNIRNSTFSGNRSVTGGAIRFQSVGGTANISNTTITGNTATSSSTTIGNGGGGISFGGTTNGPNFLNLESTIVSGNTQSGGGGGFNDLSITGNTTINAINNAIGTNKGFTFSGSSTGNLFELPLDLDITLKTNGSANGTATHAILSSSSPLVNAGSNPASLTTDQRGTGFAREIPTGKADIGAFEYVPGTPTAIAGILDGVTADQAGVNNPYTFTITYADDTAIDVGTVINNNNAIRVTGPGGFDKLATYVSITNSTNGTPRTATYSLAVPGGTWDKADNGTYSVSVEANQVKATSLIAVPASLLGQFFVGIPSTYTVTNDADSGPGSLRQALDDANAVVGTPDTINFDPGFFSSKRTIAPLTALAVSDGVTINGPGSNLLTIDAGGKFRVLDVSGAPIKSAVNISGMTLTGGSTTGNGGGILVADELLTLNDLVITNSTALEGGGISLQGAVASLKMTGCTVSGNTASGGDGGAINVNAACNVEISTTTLSGNSAKSDGGALYFLNGGSLLMNRSTISGNSASGAAGTYNTGGGGIYFYGKITANGFKISNSTISGNSHTLLMGGGITFQTVNGTPEILNTTITKNFASGEGGGIARASGTNSITLTSSIVSVNKVDFGSTHDIFSGGASIDATFSAVGVDSVGALNDYTGSGKNNIDLGTPLNLGPLADNGGPTLTHLPGPGALINHGANPSPLVPDVDQTGAPRNFGQTDIGAVEVQNAVAPISFSVNGGALQRSRLTKVEVFFTNAVDASTLGTINFTRTTPNDSYTVNTSNGLLITPANGNVYGVTLTFDNILNTGIQNASLADGRWRLNIPSQSFQSTLNDPTLRRLYGDADNSGLVDASDFAAFGGTFGSSPGVNNSPFDFDNSGDIGASDFGEFGNRFGVTL